jgi:integrase/recombinase XerD
MPGGGKPPSLAFSFPSIQENTPQCVLHLEDELAPLQTVVTETLKLWRKHHLTYDQTRYVAKEVRRALAIARPPTRQRVIARLSRVEEARLIDQAYRMPGMRGLLIKTLFPTGARVSEFVHLRSPMCILTSRCC